MKKVGENPPARFPDRPIIEATLPWWVAKVKPRQEKAIAFDFIQNEIEYYLPLVTKVTRRKDNNKPRKSILPLFPGYISFCAREPYADGIYKTGRVVSVIEIKYQRRFCEELTQICQALEGGVPLEPIDSEFVPGMTVEVFAGPLKGLKGVVSRIQNADRLVLSVSGLGQASMLIDTAFVKPQLAPTV